MSASFVNIIDCRPSGRDEPLLRQVRHPFSHINDAATNSTPFAKMSGVFTTVRNGLESGTWQFDTSSRRQVVEMRHVQGRVPATKQIQRLPNQLQAKM